MFTSEFDYTLPPELVAQTPAGERTGSRLLAVKRRTGEFHHHRFAEFPSFLEPGDALVLNNSKVIPARLRGVNPGTGGRFELLLLEEARPNVWWAMLKPGKRARPGSGIELVSLAGEKTGILATVLEKNEEGHGLLAFEGTADIRQELLSLGEMPLPPYIQRSAGPSREADRERYQTAFARVPGSVAAPTAGLHFSAELLQTIRNRGIEVCFLTLHVGLGTFSPVKVERIEHHPMHQERYNLPGEVVETIARTRKAGRKVVAVGTTSLRVLEGNARAHGGNLVAGAGQTSIFIHPPFEFKIVDALLTNFHLPKSTLLMLVSAFAAPSSTAGIDMMRRAYAEAIEQRYRFFSYGDAMFLL